MGIRDTRMMAKALIQRYPMDDKLRAGIIGALVGVLVDKNASPRAKISAARALIAADRNNIEQEKLAQIDEHHLEKMQGEQLDRIANAAQRLGLARVVDAIAQDRSGSHSAGNVEAGGTRGDMEGRKDPRS